MLNIAIHDWIAIAVLILSIAALFWIAHRADCRARKRAELARSEAKQKDRAERVARIRRFLASQPVRTARPEPGMNPGPGLRPHPLRATVQSQGTRPAWVIPPASTFEPYETPSCGLDTSPSDHRAAAVIASLSVPMPESAGEFSGAGASGSWDSSPATSTPGD